MSKNNKGPFVAKRKFIPWWKYDLSYGGKRYRGWIGAVSEMPRKAATAAFKKIYAAAVTTAESTPDPEHRPAAAHIFGEYESYLKSHHLKTWETYRFCAPHFTSFFGRMTDITPQDIAAYQAHMLAKNNKNDKSFSKTTVNRHLDYCRAAFRRFGIVPNPFASFSRFTEQSRTRYLTEQELKALLAAVAASPNDQLRGIVMTAMMTGLRKENILRLHARHIDFSNSIIRITVKGGKLHTVPIPAQLELVFKRNLNRHASGYVFENQFTHTRFNDIKRAWRRSLKDAGISDFRFHDLRHTFATYALLATKNLRLVQDLLGHRSVSMTQKYAHILESQKTDAIELVSSIVLDAEKREFNDTGGDKK